MKNTKTTESKSPTTRRIRRVFEEILTSEEARKAAKEMLLSKIKGAEKWREGQEPTKDHCWHWEGIFSRGRPFLTIRKASISARKLAYLLFSGDPGLPNSAPGGASLNGALDRVMKLRVDPTCGNPLCVNPRHAKRIWVSHEQVDEHGRIACQACGRRLPFTREHFYVREKRPDGRVVLDKRCKSCRKERDRKRKRQVEREDLLARRAPKVNGEGPPLWDNDTVRLNANNPTMTVVRAVLKGLKGAHPEVVAKETQLTPEAVLLIREATQRRAKAWWLESNRNQGLKGCHICDVEGCHKIGKISLSSGLFRLCLGHFDGWVARCAKRLPTGCSVQQWMNLYAEYCLEGGLEEDHTRLPTNHPLAWGATKAILHAALQVYHGKLKTKKTCKKAGENKGKPIRKRRT